MAHSDLTPSIQALIAAIVGDLPTAYPVGIEATCLTLAGDH